MKIMATSFRRSHAGTAALCPQPCSRPMLTHACTRDSWTLTASLRQSLVGSLLLSPGSWCTQGFISALQASVAPILYKFWQLYGGVNGDLLQEGSCHRLCETKVSCTQSPCPYGRPLLTCTSTGDAQTFKGRSASVCVVGADAHKF